jgi:hypothetical protein
MVAMIVIVDLQTVFNNNNNNNNNHHHHPSLCRRHHHHHNHAYLDTKFNFLIPKL